MTTNLLSYGLPTVAAVLAGGGAGALTSWRLNRSKDSPEAPTRAGATTEHDPWVDAEIDLASVRWAEANDQPPEAAGLMAARLKTLHDIGSRKGGL